MGSGSFFKVVAKNFDVLAGPVVSLVYPLYASVKAIETKSPVDDQQWLTYWVLYSFITLFELTFATVLEWLPFWPYAKLFFNCWLVLPQFSGAAYVYQHFVRPVFVNQQTINVWYVPKKESSSSISSLSSSSNKNDKDVLQAAERYIQENGTEAFERLISKTSQSRTSASNKHSVNNVFKAPFSKLLETAGVSHTGKQKKSILEEVEAERVQRADRGENPWGETYPIFDNDYRTHYN